MRRTHLALAAAALAAFLPLVGCASGGDEDRPGGDVQLSERSWLFTVVARPRFDSFPVTTGDAGSLDTEFELLDDGSYTLIDQSGQQLAAAEYALQDDGELTLLVPSSQGTLLYRGAFGLEGDTRHVFLTDRIGDGIGLYWGTRLVAADPIPLEDLAGDYHVFVMRLILADASLTPTPDLFGISIGGTVTLAADGSMTGSGTESEVGPVTLRGAPDDFKSFLDGRFSFQLEVASALKPDYQIGFSAGGTDEAIFGVDPLLNANDTATGLAALLPKRDDTDYDRAELVGTYQLGIWTLFVSPSAPGTDSALGTLELQSDGDFLIQAESNTGDAFGYRGSWTAVADGTLTLEVDETGETWRAAFDQGYDTILFVDPVKENRGPNRQIELNLGMALRPVPESGD